MPSNKSNWKHERKKPRVLRRSTRERSCVDEATQTPRHWTVSIPYKDGHEDEQERTLHQHGKGRSGRLPTTDHLLGRSPPKRHYCQTAHAPGEGLQGMESKHRHYKSVIFVIRFHLFHSTSLFSTPVTPKQLHLNREGRHGCACTRAVVRARYRDHGNPRPRQRRGWAGALPTTVRVGCFCPSP